MRKRNLIIVVLVVLIIGFGSYMLLPSLVTKDCGSELSCMRASFDSCSMAKYSRDVQLTQTKIGTPSENTQTKYTEYAEIQGPWIGGCRIYLKWTDATGVLGNWKGSEMICLIDTKNYDLSYTGLQKTCSGRLVEAYNPIVGYNSEYSIQGIKSPLG
jgi:hypothetical protein